MKTRDINEIPAFCYYTGEYECSMVKCPVCHGGDIRPFTCSVSKDGFELTWYCSRCSAKYSIRANIVKYQSLDESYRGSEWVDIEKEEEFSAIDSLTKDAEHYLEKCVEDKLTLCYRNSFSDVEEVVYRAFLSDCVYEAPDVKE